MKNPWPEIENDNQIKGLIFLIFVVLWVSLRCYNLYPLLNEGEVGPRLSGADGYFHLRHSESVVANYPHVKRMDDMSAYPSIEIGLNQGFFDLFVATISIVSFGLLTPLFILMWNGPILTALAALIQGEWLWRRAGPWACVLSFCFLVAYPACLTQVAAYGSGDHHCFEIFLATGLVILLFETLESSRPVQYILCPSVLLYIFYLSWPGAALHLFIIGVCLFLLALQKRESKEQSKTLMLKGVALGFSLGVMVLVTRFIAPNYIIYNKSELVFLAGSIALSLGYAPLILVSDRLPTIGKWVLTGSLVFGIKYLVGLSPEASSVAGEFFGVRSNYISEQADISVGMLNMWYGINLLALLTTPIILAWRKQLSKYLVPTVYCTGIIFFWLMTRDFYYYSPLFLAGLAAYSFSRLPWKAWTLAILAILLLYPLASSGPPQKPWHPYSRAVMAVLHTPGIDKTSRWLREFKASYGKDMSYGVLAPWDLGSTLAALSNTPVSNSQTHSPRLAKILYGSDLEEIHDKLINYHDSGKTFRFILIPSLNLEQKFGTELQVAGRNPGEVYEKGAWVVRGQSKVQIYQKNQEYFKTFISVLFDLTAADNGHYRLVYESPDLNVRAIRLLDNLKRFEFAALPVTAEEYKQLQPQFRYRNKIIETSRGLLVNPDVSREVRLFEMVPGALLTGKAKPHQAVLVTLSLKSPLHDTPIPVSWRTHADSDGIFKVRVPYPTGGPIYDIPGTIIAAPEYTVLIEHRKFTAKVTEEQVQSEAVVEVQ